MIITIENPYNPYDYLEAADEAERKDRLALAEVAQFEKALADEKARLAE